MLEQKQGEESPHNSDTLLKVIIGERRKEVQKLFDELCDGERRGMIILLSDTGEPAEGVEPTENGIKAEGLMFTNGVPMSVLLRVIVDHLDLSMSEVLRALEDTRVVGEIIKH